MCHSLAFSLAEISASQITKFSCYHPIEFACMISSAVIDIQLPTSLTAETIIFPTDLSMFSGINTSVLQIMIPKEAILYRFIVEG